MGNLTIDNDNDNDNDTDFDAWENLELNYFDEMDKCSEAVRQGSKFCMHFETESGEDFSWEELSASDVYDAVCKNRWAASFVREVHSLGISQNDLIDGIDSFMDIKGCAEQWARMLAIDFPRDTDDSDDEGPREPCSTLVDCYISEWSDEDDSLRYIRKTDPIMYSQICLETSRVLTWR